MKATWSKLDNFAEGQDEGRERVAEQGSDQQTGLEQNRDSNRRCGHALFLCTNQGVVAPGIAKEKINFQVKQQVWLLWSSWKESPYPSGNSNET